MNELTYEHIDVNKLPAEVIMQFKRYNRQDNSLVLIRYKEEQETQPIVKKQGVTFAGTHIYELELPQVQRQVEAVVIIFRTSTNHYIVTGSNEKYSRAGNGKTVAEVGAFIKRHFCRTLLD